jgi:hypothetical protein
MRERRRRSSSYSLRRACCADECPCREHLVPAARDQHGSARDLGGVVERSRVAPTVALIEPPGPGVPGDDREPPHIEANRDHLLGVSQQGRRGASAASVLGNVDLLDLVVAHGHEPDDAGGDGGHRRRLETGGDPLAEVDEPAVTSDGFGDMPEMSVEPTAVPQRGDRLDVVGGGGSKRRHGLGRAHRILRNWCTIVRQ